MLGGSSSSSTDRRVDIVLARRGGDTQRAKAQARLGPPRESEVAKLLYYFFMWGILPAKIVQRIASAMSEDLIAVGAYVDHRIVFLAGLGSHGRYTSNIRSELVNSFKSLLGIVEPCWIRVAAIITKPNVTPAPTWIDHPLILMNELFDALFHHYPTYFAQSLGCGLENFWNKVVIIHCGFIKLSLGSWHPCCS